MLTISHSNPDPVALDRFLTIAADGPLHIQDPGLKLLSAERDGAIVGRLCAFINHHLPADPAPPGLIGWYACTDDSEASIALLNSAAEILGDRGCTRVIGPIDGDTWHRYRVALPSNEPPFFLDLQNPAWYAGQWRSAGFSPVAEYFSSEIPVASVDIDRIENDAERYRQQGVTIRPIDATRYESELALIHQIALQSFDRNFLYTPISLADFLSLYRPVLPVVVPDLVELAFAADGEPVAFCFALPDLLAPAGTRVIAKTAGKIRSNNLRGLGTHMIERVVLNAARLGCESVVHALMHRDNRSGRILDDLARPIRSYQLFGREI